MVKAELVERAIDEHDARQFRLRATEAGKALRKRADPLSLEIKTLILSALSDVEHAQSRRTLEKLNLWLNEEFQPELQRRYPDAARKSSKTRV